VGSAVPSLRPTVPSLRPTVRKHFVSVSTPRTSFLTHLLIRRSPSSHCHKHTMSSKQDLKALQKVFNNQAWIRNHSLEPVVGHPLCPAGAETHGICGLSCFTAFVKESATEGEEGKWECRFEACRGSRVTSLEDAIRHVRYLHFDHRPFVCTQWSVHVTVSQPHIDTLPSLYLLDCTVPVGSTPQLTWRTTSSTAHNGPFSSKHGIPSLGALFIVSTKLSLLTCS